MGAFECTSDADAEEVVGSATGVGVMMMVAVW